MSDGRAALSEPLRRELRAMLHDARHQATARNLSSEQVTWIRRLLVQALRIVEGEQDGTD